jgi:hypothetical protein
MLEEEGCVVEGVEGYAVGSVLELALCVVYIAVLKLRLGRQGKERKKEGGEYVQLDEI